MMLKTITLVETPTSANHFAIQDDKNQTFKGKQTAIYGTLSAGVAENISCHCNVNIALIRVGSQSTNCHLLKCVTFRATITLQKHQVMDFFHSSNTENAA